MIWNSHSREFPKGSHALFSPSQPSFLSDESTDDIFKRYRSSVATLIGTEVHEEAEECIKTYTNYTKNEAKKVLTKRLVLKGISRTVFDAEFLANNFVNYVRDAIGFGMIPEQPLYYSKWCAGWADSIIFDDRKTRPILRIHDLKTGVTPAKFLQLEAYAGLFFLEYGSILGVKPGECDIVLRIYQGGEVLEECPTAEVILPIMDSFMWHTNVMNTILEG